ncbi:MAG: hypothetical protein ACRDOI_34440, partial [Trebonia sp.]
MSGADALLVVGLVAMALAFGAFAIILRRFPPRSQPAASTTDELAEQQRAAQAQDQAQTEAERIRARAQADADRLLGRAAEAAEQAAQQAADGRREVEDEIRAVKDEMRQLRGDLE